MNSFMIGVTKKKKEGKMNATAVYSQVSYTVAKNKK